MPTVNISMTEAQIWKLKQLQKRTGISASGLMRRALCFLVSELESYTFPGGSTGVDVTEQDLEREYAQRQE